MTSISSISSARTTTPTQVTSTPRTVTPAEQTGFSARIAQLGPVAGAIVGTTDLIDTAADATYTIASKKLNQLGDAVENVAEKASDGLQKLEHSIEDGAKSAATSVKNAAQRVGQWLNVTA